MAVNNNKAYGGLGLPPETNLLDTSRERCLEEEDEMKLPDLKNSKPDPIGIKIPSQEAKRNQSPRITIMNIKAINQKQQNPTGPAKKMSKIEIGEEANGKQETAFIFEDLKEQKCEAIKEKEEEAWRPRTPENETELKQMLEELEKQSSLPEKPKPKPVDFRPGTKASVRMSKIQKYISSFEYNHTGTNYFSIRKDRGPKRLATTAREIMRECLPIKCIEAVFLAFYLTLNMRDMIRIPIRFQSSIQNGKFRFRHIIMAVNHDKTWGALGLSRKNTLMYKGLRFSSLSKLLNDFKNCYHDIGHELDHIGIGLPFGHDEHSLEPIHWRPLMVHFNNERRWDDLTENSIDTYANKLDIISTHVLVHGQLPKWFHEQFPNVEQPMSSPNSKDEDTDNNNTEGFRGLACSNSSSNLKVRKPKPSVPRLSHAALKSARKLSLNGDENLKKQKEEKQQKEENKEQNETREGEQQEQKKEQNEQQEEQEILDLSSFLCLDTFDPLPEAALRDLRSSKAEPIQLANNRSVLAEPAPLAVPAPVPASKSQPKADPLDPDSETASCDNSQKPMSNIQKRVSEIHVLNEKLQKLMVDVIVPVDKLQF